MREIEAASKPAAAPREEDQTQTAYSPSAGFSAMTVDDLHDNLVKGSMLVVDVRSRQAYRRAHAKTFPWQSVNIPFTEFSRHVEDLCLHVRPHFSHLPIVGFPRCLRLWRGWRRGVEQKTGRVPRRGRAWAFW